MKKIFCLLLAAIVLSVLFPAPIPAARAEARELTILVYICGSDLESESGEASTDIREMLSSGIGNSGAVSVLLATGGSSKWSGYGISSRSVQYYRLDGSNPVLLQDVGQRSMGDARTLNDFLRFGISSSPANRYILIIWDHGGGPVYGVCNDENYQDESLSLAELKTGLTDGLQGNKLDVIAFDCCLMNCVDLCSDLYGIADYSVVSQELVSGTGLNYDEWMGPVVSNPGISSEQIAQLMAETYVQENSRGRNASTATMTVVDSGKMAAVMQAANDFSASLTGLMSTNLAGVVRLRNQLTSFGEFLDYDASDLVDVSDMCDAFSALLPQESAALKQAAQQAVCYNYTTTDIANYAHGMSFFMPYKTASSDRKEILSHYSGIGSSYATLAAEMTSQVVSSGYVMTASSYTPTNFYTSYDDSCSGSFCDVWDGYYGDYCSFDDAYTACEGDIWAGLSPSGGCIWDGYSSSSGIWDGYVPSQPSAGAPEGGGIWSGLGESGGTDTSSSGDGQQASAGTSEGGGIWSGLEETGGTGASSSGGQQASASASASASTALHNIWEGLLNEDSAYYQPGEENQNVQPGVSEAVPAEDVLATADAYFSSSTLSAQMIYSLQLTRDDLNQLSAASGVLSRKEGDEIIRLGNMGQTTIDWSTGLIFSMFDGSWPMLEGQMVRAEYFYGDEDGSVRFVIPARVNGLKMYLVGRYTGDGQTELLGATQGYDEQGFAIRGVIPLEAGMIVYPMFTAVSPDGTEREYDGAAITVPAGGMALTWGKIPGGSYEYCFGLTDLSGQVHYTDSIPMDF